ncbi:MAG: hypothetical protein AAFO58_09705 [Pseudomonadota bacterium]
MKYAILTPAILIAGTALAMTDIDPAVDTNEDGFYSWEEMSAAYPDLTEDTFSVIDVTEDGLVDADELARATEAALLPVTDG